MRPESAWLYHFRQLVTDPEFHAWLVSLAGTAVLTLWLVMIAAQ